MPKTDLVATYHNEDWFAPLFWWGVRENIGHLNKIFVVKDGIWGPSERRRLLSPVVGDSVGDRVVLMDHPKVAHGVAQGQNMAAKISTADFLFFISFDQVLSPGCIEAGEKKASAERLVTGHVHSIDKLTSIVDLPYPRITRRDQSLSRSSIFDAAIRPWKYVHNGHMMVRTADFLEVGGMDERLGEIGYGLEDQEFAVRWCTRFGLASIRISYGETWHHSSEKPSPEERAHKRPAPESFEILARSLGDLYGERWSLFGGPPASPTDHIWVGHDDWSQGTEDVCLPCVTPSWLPEAKCFSIETWIPNQFIRKDEDVRSHIKFLWTRLQVGGSLKIPGFGLTKPLSAVSAELGVCIDVENNHIEICKEEQ